MISFFLPFPQGTTDGLRECSLCDIRRAPYKSHFIVGHQPAYSLIQGKKNDKRDRESEWHSGLPYFSVIEMNLAAFPLVFDKTNLKITLVLR